MQELDKRYSTEIEQIKANAMKMSWYMRGGLDLIDALNLSAKDMDLINQLIDDNLETTKKTKLPFF